MDTSVVKVPVEDVAESIVPKAGDRTVGRSGRRVLHLPGPGEHPLELPCLRTTYDENNGDNKLKFFEKTRGQLKMRIEEEMGAI